MKEYNIYCDESCHLPFDKQPKMVLGAVWCENAKAHELFLKIRDLKKKHHLSPYIYHLILKLNSAEFRGHIT